ncbi:MAG: putative metalloprotease CJM1_0395 family protein [Lamprobacter sp.]|uniref:putative metalloprotease CJM1_0395 family protein n=1 Tax=Lamprobacter sp. TaxID=3100796 RepID=UPI002B25D606|nr:putative metalloprotease CJM1_0395 family protein [Lamprobacter sp.]MEA3639759.1 putative metalloprotease CJM1_0395 family protein [Lamprobacter sp.]
MPAVSPISSIPSTGNLVNGSVTPNSPGWRPSIDGAKTALGQSQSDGATSATEETARVDPVGETAASSKTQPNALSEELSPQELRLIDQMKQTDREVRQHELAHQIVGGPYTGSAQYEYRIGPDGQRYAVAGKVSVDYGPVTGDPRATIDKMQIVISAALAPADPSPSDYQVAARARQYLLMAQLELSQQQTETVNIAIPERAAANDDESEAIPLSRDPRVEEYSRIATTTGQGAEVAQAILRSVA